MQSGTRDAKASLSAAKCSLFSRFPIPDPHSDNERFREKSHSPADGHFPGVEINLPINNLFHSRALVYGSIIMVLR